MIIGLYNGRMGRRLRKRPTIRNRRGLLSDRDIVTAVRRGELIVAEFDKSMLRPASLSLRLGAKAYQLVSERRVEVDDQETHPRLEPRWADQDGRIILYPNEVLLVRTLERIGLSDRIAGIIDGTSDYARLGVSVVLSHQVSPGYGMPFGAPLTLEIVSRLRHPIYLRPGTRICNLMMFRGRWSHRSYSEMVGSHSTSEWSVCSRISEHLDAGMEATITMPDMVETAPIRIIKLTPTNGRCVS
jgi:dCTP deaminase